MYGKTDVPGTAVVTGGASGIGLATAIAFALAGCSKIALLDISDQNLQAAKAAIIDTLGSANLPTIPIELIHCDVSSADSVAEAYATVIKLLDRIDYSVHCAGIVVRGGRSVDCSVEDFDRQNTVAYRGLWLCSRQALTTMKTQTLDCEAYPDANIPEPRAQRGAIVNISSQLARGWQDGKQAYIASKAAVLALTHCDALDYVNERIRVNCVLPGVVETPMTTATPEIRSNVEAASVARTPMKRFGRPEEIADTIVFLSGNRSSFTTGAEFVVDGGYCAQ